MEGAPAWHKEGRCGQKVNCPRAVSYTHLDVYKRQGLESTDLKLLTALVVAVFLAVPYWKGRYFTKPVREEGAPHA